MSLNAPTRFGDAVNSVFIRCSVSTTGNQFSSFLPLVREFVRSAHTQLYPEGEWTSALVSTEIALTQGVVSYDWPDDCLPGRINFMSVLDTSNRAVLLDFGLKVNERSTANRATPVQGCPLVATYMDGMIELTPAPDALWVTLRIEYTKSVTSLVDDEDELIVDGELVIQAAAMKFKDHLGLTVTPKDIAEHERYLSRLKAMQSNGEGFQLGGHQSIRNHVQKRNRIGAWRNNVGNSAPISDDWAPF